MKQLTLLVFPSHYYSYILCCSNLSSDHTAKCVCVCASLLAHQRSLQPWWSATVSQVQHPSNQALKRAANCKLPTQHSHPITLIYRLGRCFSTRVRACKEMHPGAWTKKKMQTQKHTHTYIQPVCIKVCAQMHACRHIMWIPANTPHHTYTHVCTHTLQFKCVLTEQWAGQKVQIEPLCLVRWYLLCCGTKQAWDAYWCACACEGESGGSSFLSRVHLTKSGSSVKMPQST